jgi:hypothetical protein
MARRLISGDRNDAVSGNADRPASAAALVERALHHATAHPDRNSPSPGRLVHEQFRIPFVSARAKRTKCSQAIRFTTFFRKALYKQAERVTNLARH